MEDEELQSYKAWIADHAIELFGMEDSRVCLVKLFTSLKQDIIMNMLSIQRDDSLDTQPKAQLGQGLANGRVNGIPYLPKAPMAYLLRLVQTT